MYGDRFEGLTYLGEADLSEPDYSFDIVGAWHDEDGGIYLGTDSGCSCPSPWESHTKDNLTGPLTKSQAAEEILSLAEVARDGVYSEGQIGRLIGAVYSV